MQNELALPARARARATLFLGNRFGSNSSFEKARAHGKERERRAGERRTFANPSRPSPRKGRVPRAIARHARVTRARFDDSRIVAIGRALTDQRKYAGLVEQRLETVFDESGRGAVLVTHFTHCATKPT